jgi:hypothetical protein
MLDPASFQIIIGFVGLGFILYFLDSIDGENPENIKAEFLGVLIFYTISIFSLLIPATTRKSFELLGVYIPPIHVWLEAFTMAFLLTIGWKIFYD